MIETVNQWAGQPLPLSATAWEAGVLRVRLSGAASAVAAARAKLGGAEVADGAAYWEALREHRLPFFAADRPLWRLSVAQTAAPVAAGAPAAHRVGRRAALGERRARRGARARGCRRRAGATRRSSGAATAPPACSIRSRPAHRQDPPPPEGRLRPRRDPQPRPPGQLLTSRMQTNLADWIKDTPEGREADAILRKCVHCGFCLATCPTYNLLGDELDSPRGRIYLMKQALEGAPVTATHAGAPRPLPHLPRLRDHLPVGRAVRPARGHRPRGRGEEGAAHVRRRRLPPAAALRVPLRAALRLRRGDGPRLPAAAARRRSRGRCRRGARPAPGRRRGMRGG